MPTSGLLLTLSDAPARLPGTLRQIESRDELTCGAAHDRWLPVVLEATDDEQSRSVHDWLMSLPGVEFVDVVSVNFEPIECLNEK